MIDDMIVTGVPVEHIVFKTNRFAVKFFGNTMLVFCLA
jgi:hypothetical protein